MKSTQRETPFKRAAAPKPKFARGTRASFQSCLDPNINGTGLVVEAKYFPKDGRFLYTVEHNGKHHTLLEEEMAKPSDKSFKDRRQIALDLCEHPYEHPYDDMTREIEI